MFLPISAVISLLSLPFVLGFNYTIGVGKDQVTGLPGVGFDPIRTIVASNSDIIVFQMLPGVHQVIQTTFNSPCVPGLSGGFDSGLVNVTNSTENIMRGPHFPFLSNQLASSVFWFYDGGAQNCYQGAVFCVNCNGTGTETIDNFRSAALALGAAQGIASSIRSDAPFSTTTPPISSSTAVANSTSATSTSNSTATASSTAKPASGERLVVGGSLILGVIGGLIGLIV